MSDQERNEGFEALLDYLAANRGFDFKGYKRSSLMRRVERRMQTVEVGRFEDYIDFLEVHPDEFAQLFNMILINVTAFFRDPPSWEYLATDVVPQILAARRDGGPIRVWSAGCASGEEAYTAAMVLAEALGADQFRERVKIYATDADEDALAQARLAAYSDRQLQAVPDELRERYFEAANGRRTFRADLRRSVIFGRHDLVQDAPISRLDLLVCRNVLIYLNAETQSHVLARFHFALGERGFMFLGRAEMLLTHTDTFTPLDVRHRIFSPVPHFKVRDRVLALTQLPGREGGAHHIPRQARLREAAFDAGPVGSLVVDTDGLLLAANERMRTLFGIGARDLGRPLQDLEVSYRPVELRGLIEKAYEGRSQVTVQDVSRSLPGGGAEHFEVHVSPLAAEGGGWVGAVVCYNETSRAYQDRGDLIRSAQELAASNEELQSTTEELETTNEELQSSNEELETTNEELQSANEELETMNEELQSSNEELQTVNDELRQRTDEFNASNRSLREILGSIAVGLVVVDRDFAVTVWNRASEELWGLRSDEVRGRSLMGLDIGLPVERLRAPILAGISGEMGEARLVLDATNRRGRRFKCGVTITTFPGQGDATVGAALVFEDVTGREKEG